MSRCWGQLIGVVAGELCTRLMPCSRAHWQGSGRRHLSQYQSIPITLTGLWRQTKKAPDRKVPHPCLTGWAPPNPKQEVLTRMYVSRENCWHTHTRTHTLTRECINKAIKSLREVSHAMKTKLNVNESVWSSGPGCYSSQCQISIPCALHGRRQGTVSCTVQQKKRAMGRQLLYGYCQVAGHLGPEPVQSSRCAQTAHNRNTFTVLRGCVVSWGRNAYWTTQTCSSMCCRRSTLMTRLAQQQTKCVTMQCDCLSRNDSLLSNQKGIQPF